MYALIIQKNNSSEKEFQCLRESLNNIGFTQISDTTFLTKEEMGLTPLINLYVVLDKHRNEFEDACVMRVTEVCSVYSDIKI